MDSVIAQAARCREWDRTHRAERRLAAREYRRANPGARKATEKRYRDGNLAKRHALNRAWRVANQDRVRQKYLEWYGQQSPATIQEKRKRYNERNRERTCAWVAKRTARKQAAPGRGISAEEWQGVLADSLGLCAYCNERNPLALDHIEPLFRGGEHDIENTTAACKSCNSSKQATPLLLWLARRASVSVCLRAA